MLELIFSRIRAAEGYFKGETVVSLSGSWNSWNSCGHSFGITRTGKLFTWGYNNEGQLGLNNNNKSVNIPNACYSDIFGVFQNDKMYKNDSFEDVDIKFE